MLVQWMKGFVKVTLSKSILAFGNLVIVIQSSSSVQLFCDSTRLVPARLLFLCPWDYPDKDTEVGCCFHLQGIFPTQGSNQSLLKLAGSFFTAEPYEIVQFSSVAQSCPTLCDPMNRSTPGLPIHHQLPEFTQTHVH